MCSLTFLARLCFCADLRSDLDPDPKGPSNSYDILAPLRGGLYDPYFRSHSYYITIVLHLFWYGLSPTAGRQFMGQKKNGSCFGQGTILGDGPPEE